MVDYVGKEHALSIGELSEICLLDVTIMPGCIEKWMFCTKIRGNRRGQRECISGHCQAISIKYLKHRRYKSLWHIPHPTREKDLVIVINSVYGFTAVLYVATACASA